MPFIALTDYTPLTEGTHVFEITDTTYDEEFGKLKISLKTAEGATTTKTFSFRKPDGTINDAVSRIFSYFARVALQNKELKEIDPEMLVGHYIKCDVTTSEVESTTEPGKMMKFFNLNNYSEASGFGDTAVSTPNDFTASLFK